MTTIEAVLLGIIQGITEFLPISSDGHLELGKALLNIQSADNLMFVVLVHGATVLSIIILFWKDILFLLKQLFSFRLNDHTKYIGKLVLSMIPVGLVGLFLEDYVAALFGGRVVLVGVLLILNGFILLASNWRLRPDGNREVSFGDAFLIGIAQSLAVLPGISRSTCTISTALMLGIEKTQAARFSLLMVIVPILGATLLKIKDLLELNNSASGNVSAVAEQPILPYAAGFLAAFLTGLLACKWLVALVKQGKFSYFAYYCFTVGTLALIWGLCCR